MPVPYIKYDNLKEFYTIKELCNLFRMSKKELQEKCAEYDILPRRNEIGDWGLVKYDVRKLHNLLYHEKNGKKNQAEDDDPWA